MKKITSIIAVLALCISAHVKAGSGTSSGSRTSSPLPARVSAPAAAPKVAAAPQVAVQKADPPPQQATTSKSGLSGGSRPSNEAMVQKVAPQGATAQTFALQAQKSAAVAAYSQMESDKAAKVAQERRAAEQKQASTTTVGMQNHTNPTQLSGQTERTRVVVIERQGQSDYYGRSDADYWRGVAMGSMNNRPVIVNNQPSGGVVVPSTGVNQNSNGGYVSLPASDTPSESHFGRYMAWLFGLALITILCYYTVTILQRRKLAQASFRPKHSL